MTNRVKVSGALRAAAACIVAAIVLAPAIATGNNSFGGSWQVLETGKPLPGADVAIVLRRTTSLIVDSHTSCAGGQTAITDPSGRFSVPRLRDSDDASIAVYLRGYAYVADDPIQATSKTVRLERTDDKRKLIRHIDWAFRTTYCSGAGSAAAPLIPFVERMMADLEPMVETEDDRFLLAKMREKTAIYRSSAGRGKN